MVSVSAMRKGRIQQMNNAACMKCICSFETGKKISVKLATVLICNDLQWTYLIKRLGKYMKVKFFIHLFQFMAEAENKL